MSWALVTLTAIQVTAIQVTPTAVGAAPAASAAGVTGVTGAVEEPVGELIALAILLAVMGAAAGLAAVRLISSTAPGRRQGRDGTETGAASSDPETPEDADGEGAPGTRPELAPGTGGSRGRRPGATP